MASRTLEVIIAGDATGAKRAFNAVDRQAADTDDTIRSRMSASSAAIGAAAVAGVAAIGWALKGAWDAAEESALIGRETQRVIESTGAAVWTTGDQIGDFADKISMATGVDDELIQSSENLLLTFTNVRNAFGDGNQVFDDGARLALDMSKVLGTDLNAATLQVGKALNDPIRGITALRRAGVSFTKQQEDQIKTMVESGDTLGAQKAIIAELSKEFGGAAAAAATPLDKLKVKVGNLQEKIGTALIPVVAKAAEVFSSWITWLEEHQDVAKALAVAIGVVLVGAIVAYTASMASAATATLAATWPILAIIAAVGLLVAGVVYAYNNFDWFRTAVDEAWDGIQVAVAWAWEKIEPILKAIGDWIVDTGVPFMQDLWQATRDVWDWIADKVAWAWKNVIKPTWDATWWFMENYLVPAVKKLWENFKVAWEGTAAVISWAWENVIGPAWNAMWVFSENFLVPAVKGQLQVFTEVWGGIATVVRAAWETFKPVWDAAWSFTENVLIPTMFHLRDVVAEVFGVIGSNISWAWHTVIKPVWNAAWSFTETYLVPALFRMRDAAAIAWNGVGSAVTWAWNALIRPAFDLIRGGAESMVGAFHGIVGGISSAFSHVFDAITRPFVAAFQAVKQAWNSTIGGKGGFSVPGTDLDFPGIPRMHSGGWVTGRDGEEVPRILQAGEYVVSREEVRAGVLGGGGSTYAPVYNFTINGTNMSADEIVEALKKFERRNGTAWRN